MTQDQFLNAVLSFTQATVAWNEDVAWLEGGAVGLKWNDGVALVWNRTQTWSVKRASKLEAQALVALKRSTKH